VVEGDTPGFTHGPPLHKVGQPEADTAEAVFSAMPHVSAEIPARELGRGFAYMMDRLPQERLSAAICNVAHAGGISRARSPM